MERDWARLGRELAAARKRRRPKLTQDDVLGHLDIGRTTLQRIERGRPTYSKIQPAHREYARLVGWTEESVRLVLEGKEPVMRAPEPSPPARAENAPDKPTDLSVRVMQALVEGPLIDSQVITVRTESGEVTAALVVRGEPDATPEELVEQYRAWRDRGPVLDRPDDRDADGAEVT